MRIPEPYTGSVVEEALYFEGRRKGPEGMEAAHVYTDICICIYTYALCVIDIYVHTHIHIGMHLCIHLHLIY